MDDGTKPVVNIPIDIPENIMTMALALIDRVQGFELTACHLEQAIWALRHNSGKKDDGSYCRKPG